MTCDSYSGDGKILCQLQALRKNPAERPTAKQLLLHPWVQIRAAPASKAEAAAGKQPASGAPEPDSSSSSSSSHVPAGSRHVLGVATFASPNQSLSPRMASWKIATGAPLNPLPHSGSASFPGRGPSYVMAIWA